MKRFLGALILALTISSNCRATIHEIRVWDGYLQFLPSNTTIIIGDTIDWLPLDQPMMVHTITSTTIPVGASSFDYTWQAPADTFFRYIPTVVGTYDYECSPHVTQGMTGSFIVSGPLNVSEIDMTPLIYPNPFSNTLGFNEEFIGEEFSIMNELGQVIEQGVVAKQMSFKSLNSGIYFLRIGELKEPIKLIAE